MIRVEKITQYSDFLKMEPYWDDLLNKSFHNLLFLTHDFIRTEWENLGWDLENKGELNPFILVVSENNEMLAIFPFVKENTKFYGFPVTCIRPFGHIYVDRSDMILIKRPAESIKAVLEYLKKEETAWHLLMFKNVVESSRLLGDDIALIKHNSFKFGIMDGYYSPYVEKDTDWKGYLGSRSKNFHGVLKNKMNRIKKAGVKLVAKEYYTPGDIETAMEIVFDIDYRGWKGKAGTAMSSTDKSRRYWHTLSKYLVKKGLVRIWILWMDSRAIAYEYHIIHCKRVYSLKWGYDEEYGSYSPGLLLKFNSMESFWNSDIAEIDLLGSTDSFKEKWTDKKRRHYNLYIFNSGIYTCLIHSFVFRFRVVLLKIASLLRIRAFLPKYLSKGKNFLSRNPAKF